MYLPARETRVLGSSILERFDERVTRGESDGKMGDLSSGNYFDVALVFAFPVQGATFSIAFVTFLISGPWRNCASFCARAFAAQRSKSRAWTES
jgi:hypothetical protein